MLAALVLSATGGAHAGTSLPSCARDLPQGAAGLPAEIVVTTRCGRFGLEPTASVVFKGMFTLPVPRGAIYSPDDLTWYRFLHGHLLIGRGLRQLWRSHDRYRGTYPGNVGEVILGARELAFSYYESGRPPRPPHLYLARYGGRERRVAEGETPLEFPDSGELVAWRERSRALVIRTAAGRFERLLASQASDPQVDRQSGMLLFRAHSALRVFDGHGVQEVARLGDLGLDRGTTVVEPLGRLVALHNRNRLVVIDYDGQIVASTVLPEHPQQADGVSSSVVANADGTAVAFTATAGNTAYGSHGHEVVYLLADGERQARPLSDEELDFNLCERAAWLAWRGQWLLYSNTEQRAAVVDSSGVAAPIELSGVISRLPGTKADGFFDISWAGSS